MVSFLLSENIRYQTGKFHKELKESKKEESIMAGDIVLWMREIELLSKDKRVVEWLDQKYKGDYGYFASNYGKYIRYEGLPEDYGLCIKRSRDGVCLNLIGSISHKEGSISIPMLKEAVESLMTDSFRGNVT